MSRHLIAQYIVKDRDAWSACERDLRAAGFDVRRVQRAGGTLLGVVVRDDTDDESEATRLIERYVPGVRRGPSSAPTHHRAGYREGR